MACTMRKHNHLQTMHHPDVLPPLPRKPVPEIMQALSGDLSPYGEGAVVGATPLCPLWA